MVSITQRFAKMREARTLKIQAYATRQKETVIKGWIQPWLDEAFAVSTTIKQNVAHLQAAYAPKPVTEGDTDALMAHIEQVS